MPEYPCTQEQKYRPELSTSHDPPFLHGEGEQMFAKITKKLFSKRKSRQRQTFLNPIPQETFQLTMLYTCCMRLWAQTFQIYNVIAGPSKIWSLKRYFMQSCILLRLTF